ncbi:TPA: DUF645 family protein [Vibrio cholerae]|nr:DUF645 family protein [Vibrio cholerae]
MEVQRFQNRRKPTSLDASPSLDVQHGQLSFTKGCIIAVILLSLSRTLNRGQLSLDSFEFWLPTSQL